MRLTEEEYAALISKRKALRQPEKKEKRVNGGESKIERRFSQQLADNPDIPAHQRNYFIFPDRDFEIDFCWPALKLGVEVQGMAHRIKGKFKADIEKRALAMLAGWRILEVGGVEVRGGRALEWLRILLARP